MKPTLLFTHLHDRRAGLVREALDLAGCPVTEANFFEGDIGWSVEEIAAIVSLGGEMSTTELDRHSFLLAEVALMREALVRQIPILGICLGAQLLAIAAGGRVAPLPRIYIGWPALSLSPDADDDPLFRCLPPTMRILKWHEDAIDPPPDSTVLATTETHGAALFRVGPRAWASQMHIELTPEILLDGWLADGEATADLESSGLRIGEFRKECARRLPQQVAAVRPAVHGFAQLARQDS